MASILVIEGNELVRQFARLVLLRAGHHVRCAADGEAGERAYRESPADVVLCELSMHGPDGCRTIRSLRRQFPGARVVAVGGDESAGVDGHDLWLARHFGASALLTKPYSREELLGTVEGLLAAGGPPP